MKTFRVTFYDNNQRIFDCENLMFLMEYLMSDEYWEAEKAIHYEQPYNFCDIVKIEEI